MIKSLIIATLLLLTTSLSYDRFRIFKNQDYKKVMNVVRNTELFIQSSLEKCIEENVNQKHKYVTRTDSIETTELLTFLTAEENHQNAKDRVTEIIIKVVRECVIEDTNEFISEMREEYGDDCGESIIRKRESILKVFEQNIRISRGKLHN